jgi:predicted enzyme related to lactoylglutathione lyase
MWGERATVRWQVGAISLLSACALILLPAQRAAAAEPGIEVEVAGLELRVLDVDQAVGFLALYGFTPEGRPTANDATVKNGAAVIDLVKIARRVELDDRLVSNVHINLRVEDLGAALAELSAKAPGYQVLGDLRRPFPLGHYAIVQDPSGNTFHLIEPSTKPPEGIRRGIFNVGITLSDMSLARRFYRDQLGFEIFSEDYFPPDLPLKRKGALPLVLHQTAEGPALAGYPETAATIVVLNVTDLGKATRVLSAQGVRLLDDAPRATPHGPSVAIADPFGLVFQLRERVGH